MIAIYEPLYRPQQQELQEPAFLPFRVENPRPEWRELGILVDMFRKGIHRQQALTGLFSPRFRVKTKITGAEFIAHIEKNPGADAYILNSPAHLPCFSYTMWMEGEWNHPGLTGRAQALLDACGIAWRVSETPRQGPDVTCYNNFWVGTERLWDNYVGGVLIPIAEFLERNPESDVAKAVLAPTFHRDPAPFLPFIVERLFSTYLSHAKPKVAPYMLDPLKTCTLDFEREILAYIGGRVKRADREGHFPPDLIAWMNLLCRLRARYRFAYFATHPDPYSGKAVDRELIEIGLNGLKAIPLPPLP